MKRSSFLLICVFFTVLSGLFQESHAIYCWNCASDNDAFCRDPFEEPAHILGQNGDMKFDDCSVFETTSKKAVCMKTKEFENGRTVLRRQCGYAKVGVSPAQLKKDCLSEYNRLSCDICDTSGCNGAAAYGPVTAVIVTSLASVKFLSLL
ncbi:hypothetical protein Bhyg_14501 [Pseudolycoriella hygida]|uniref:Protein sleepless n=1 Tax=Pseudolycoriella hygida TaxID=35572 RepID=A0A9Q0MQ15_9DIPT|nr:hypothetical protein Bhyg_14501 [Pseudolycoriella hygida]